MSFTIFSYFSFNPTQPNTTHHMCWKMRPNPTHGWTQPMPMSGSRPNTTHCANTSGWLHSWLVNTSGAGRPRTQLPLNARLLLIWSWARNMSQVQIKDWLNGIIAQSTCTCFYIVPRRARDLPLPTWQTQHIQEDRSDAGTATDDTLQQPHTSVFRLYCRWILWTFTRQFSFTRARPYPQVIPIPSCAESMRSYRGRSLTLVPSCTAFC